MSDYVELLIPVERDAAAQLRHQPAAQSAPAMEQVACQARSEKGKGQDFLNMSVCDKGLRCDLLIRVRLTLLQPAAPLVGSGQSPQHDRIRLASALIEHNGPIAICEPCLHDDDRVLLLVAIARRLYDFDAIGMDQDALDLSE